jgi:hypothetical protein
MSASNLVELSLRIILCSQTPFGFNILSGSHEVQLIASPEAQVKQVE